MLLWPLAHLPCWLDELDEHPSESYGLEESDASAVPAKPRTLVEQGRLTRGQVKKCAVEVVHLKCDMVKCRAPSVEEAAYRSGPGRLEELERAVCPGWRHPLEKPRTFLGRAAMEIEERGEGVDRPSFLGGERHVVDPPDRPIVAYRLSLHR